MAVRHGDSPDNRSELAFPDEVACAVACDEAVVAEEVPDDAARLRLEAEHETRHYVLDSVNRELTGQMSAPVEHGDVGAEV